MTAARQSTILNRIDVALNNARGKAELHFNEPKHKSHQHAIELFGLLTDVGDWIVGEDDPHILNGYESELTKIQKEQQEYLGGTQKKNTSFKKESEKGEKIEKSQAQAQTHTQTQRQAQ